ncbi:MAG: hypothetical protein ISF22_00215 [Methanomassiliicoccus sp.]|nr:hypothetical protein [Methanomassiliicoccus sp.]
MGIFSGISESVVSGIMCSYLQKYSGPKCGNLRKAIVRNVDLYRLWTENAASEGVRGPREVRQWTKMFPKTQRLMTPQNVKRWLREQGLDEIAATVEGTEGGDAWLAWQVERFRTGLWGQ